MTGIQEEKVTTMAAPKNIRLKTDFDEWFPQWLYLVGEIQPVTEYQSAEDKARNRPVRPRVDEMSGLPLFRGTFADPAAEKDREKSVTVKFACAISRCPGGGGGDAVPAGGAGGHDRGSACGSLRSSQVDHVGGPGHWHDDTQHHGQRDSSRQTGVGQSHCGHGGDD